MAPITYCEVHGYNPPKEGKIQVVAFYGNRFKLTLNIIVKTTFYI